MGLAATGETGYVDQRHSFLGIGVQVAVEFNYSFSGSMSWTRVGGDIDEGEDPVEAVLHVGHEVFRVRNGCWVPVGLEKWEVVVGDFERFHGADQRVGCSGGFGRGTADESRAGGEVGWGADCMGDVDPLGGVVGAEKKLAVVGVDPGLKVVQVGQGGQVVRGQAKGADFVVVEL